MAWKDLTITQRSHIINKLRPYMTTLSEMRQFVDSISSSPSGRYDPYLEHAQAPVYAKGGSIHIKPENRGKFTALKKRTGHSASWFKEHGTPAQKKMAVFALNSKHWGKKKAHGGILF